MTLFNRLVLTRRHIDKMKKFDFVVIGGGIVGAAVARNLALSDNKASLLVVEKERVLALHQSGRNSGVIHSGLYYKPGSLKSEFCYKGRQQLISYARSKHLDIDLCGKLVVATTDGESEELERLYKNGNNNGLSGLRLLNKKEIKAREPNVAGVSALLVPEAGIIDYAAVTRAYMEDVTATSERNEVLTGFEVANIQKLDCRYKVTSTTAETVSGRVLINCSGLFSDRICELSGSSPNVKIVPFRGDYYALVKSAKDKVKHLIYPVPDKRFPFLGVHFTRMIDGSVECGPNAVFSFKRDGYNKTDFSFQDTIESLRFKGTQKLFKKYWKYGVAEYQRAFSKKKFLASLRKLVPSIDGEDIVAARAGIRAQAVDASGNLLSDFYIVSDEASVHILNAPSPAATSSLAIGEHVANLARSGI